MRKVEVIPRRVHIHKPTGRQASIYGSAPWTSEREREEWETVERGYTWEITDHDGRVTVGACRRPAATREEAEEVAAQLRAL